jgi:hypothetical protein
MWRILKIYGIPEKYIRIIKQLYENYRARVVNNGKVSEQIKIASGIRQGCVLSPTVFLVVVDWVMRKATQDRTGLQWYLFTQLEDLEFVDDICLSPKRNSIYSRKPQE